MARLRHRSNSDGSGDDSDGGDGGGAGGAPPLAASWWAIAGITIANGADNISVYAPLLRTQTPVQAVVLLVVFYLGLALWLALAYLLGRHHRVAEVLGRIQHWLGPLIFTLGVAILLDLL